MLQYVAAIDTHNTNRYPPFVESVRANPLHRLVRRRGLLEEGEAEGLKKWVLCEV